MKITKETGIVIIFSKEEKACHDFIKKEICNILVIAEEVINSIGYKYSINDEYNIIVKVFSQDGKEDPDIRDLYTIFAELINSINELHSNSKQSFSAGISIGEVSLAEKSARDLIEKYGALKSFLIDEDSFTFINDEIINLYSEDKQMNNLDKWHDFITPDKVKKMIAKKNIYYIQ